MKKVTRIFFCNSCKQEIGEKEAICPHCGSNLGEAKRTIKVNVADKIRVMTSLGIKQTKPDIPGYAVKARYEEKISGETKRPTKEQYVVDRTDPKKTKIIHHIKELNGDEWIPVHDHEDAKPAKRKRKRK